MTDVRKGIRRVRGGLRDVTCGVREREESFALIPFHGRCLTCGKDGGGEGGWME